jgi:phage baseplate assembly protein W
MAIEVKRINPLDLKPSTGIGFALPFSGEGVFNTTYTTKDSIKANLINYFLTNQNERPLNPSFGASIRGFIFQAISSNSLDSLEARLRSEVQRFFPDIEIEELKVTSENPDLQAVTITLRYRVRQFSIQDEFTIVLQQ